MLLDAIRALEGIEISTHNDVVAKRVGEAEHLCEPRLLNAQLLGQLVELRYAKALLSRRGKKELCCSLVLNLVTSTPQWIRLVGPRDLCCCRPRRVPRGLCLYVNVCSNVIGSCSL